jgi:COMPASS component SWD3
MSKRKLENASLAYTLTGHSHPFSLAFSPDGQTLASGSWDDTIKLWQLSTRQEIANLTGHSGDIRCVVISPDGQTLASCSEDKVIKLWQSEYRSGNSHS